jgi:hypothetical protein
MFCSFVQIAKKNFKNNKKTNQFDAQTIRNNEIKKTINFLS